MSSSDLNDDMRRLESFAALFSHKTRLQSACGGERAYQPYFWLNN